MLKTVRYAGIAAPHVHRALRPHARHRDHHGVPSARAAATPSGWRHRTPTASNRWSSGIGRLTFHSDVTHDAASRPQNNSGCVIGGGNERDGDDGPARPSPRSRRAARRAAACHAIVERADGGGTLAERAVGRLHADDARASLRTCPSTNGVAARVGAVGSPHHRVAVGGPPDDVFPSSPVPQTTALVRCAACASVHGSHSPARAERPPTRRCAPDDVPCRRCAAVHRRAERAVRSVAVASRAPHVTSPATRSRWR